MILLSVGTYEYLYYCSTTGGSGTTPVTVTTVSELISAVTGNQKKVVMISGLSLAS
jgi:pectate lyase